MHVGSASAGDGGNVYCHPSTRVEVERCFFVFSCAVIVAPAECTQAFPSVWSTCQCVLISCVIGSALRLLRASTIRAFDTENPESIRSLPSLPVRTAIFPPEPSRTLIPARRG